MLEIELLDFGRTGAITENGKILATWPVNSHYKETKMPLTKKGKKIKRAMQKTYGSEKGEEVFYKSQNKGTIKGTHKGKRRRR